MGKPSRTTMAKRNRERALQEKRQEKMARKQQRRMEKSMGIASADSEAHEEPLDEGAAGDDSSAGRSTFEESN